MLYFDVQPIAVKAYGGRGLTGQRHVVLSRRQKTRGRFYLFLLYDVLNGKVHWQYRSGKNSEHVCAFMSQVRRWYGPIPLWLAFDQDRPHPRISRRTCRHMRELHLHWISLPKGCPDDNPVETIFSTITAGVMEDSNDPNTKAMQKRISAFLRGRNRRKDRHIAIPYLSDIHTH